MSNLLRVALWLGVFCLGAAGLRGAGDEALAPRAAPLHALILSGGPDPENNTAEIEEHARFVAGLLTAAASRTTLFADGNARNATVTFVDSGSVSAGQRALEVLLPKDDFGPPTRTRAPDLGVALDGAAKRQPIHRAFARLSASSGRAATPAASVLIYVAGHGSHNKKNEENNTYELWDNESLSVRDLAAELTRLPPKTPVTLVMAQCYSGAFANVIFRGGDPKNEQLSELDLAGFFSAAADREAAGCGADVGTADFQDFSSYFFGALSERNRLGKAITGADSDKDGRVSLHEAFCHALIHDESIDTPVCTSQIFLRHFLPLSEPEIYGTPFAEILRGATAAERAALEALSERLELTGDQRLLAAYDRLSFADPVGRAAQLTRLRVAREKLAALRSETLAGLLERWPALRWKDAPEYDVTADSAMRELEGNRAACDSLLAAAAESGRADNALNVEEAFLLRFTSLCEGIVRAGHLRAGGDEALKARFERLRRAEMRSLPLGQ
jgi:hypothetical protein